jgi:hypothetical protein
LGPWATLSPFLLLVSPPLLVCAVVNPVRIPARDGCVTRIRIDRCGSVAVLANGLTAQILDAILRKLPEARNTLAIIINGAFICISALTADFESNSRMGGYEPMKARPLRHYYAEGLQTHCRLAIRTEFSKIPRRNVVRQGKVSVSPFEIFRPPFLTGR